ncbi:helicase [Mycolicibacterium fallax]|uniref:Helicase n=1 Tax=Mycolicibacterium fallax TaxID=1793 RepID=A0A1X1RK88_MYCFA|nr:helicase [Mycolicibacterium fallax]
MLTEVPATDFHPGTSVRAPSGAKARVQANLAVVDVLARLDAEGRHATADEQMTLSAWSGWGAVPDVFDNRKDTYAAQRTHLKAALSSGEYRAAEASVLNAHYTDPAIAQVMWDALIDAGFSGGRVLEPGCGSGTFIGLAPSHAQMVGVENDPVTAAVASRLYPSAQVRLEGFERTRVPTDSFAATIGNVPFGRFTVDDPAHNPGQFSIHNHFIIKSLNLTAPGGYVMVLTSHFTMDALRSKAREAIAERADLVGAVRLPSNAFQRVAGTAVVTDVLVFRRREPGIAVKIDELDWVRSSPMAVQAEESSETADLYVNDYFQAHPENILGQPRRGHGLHGSEVLTVHGDLDSVPADLANRLSAMIAAARDNGRGLTATADSLTDVSEIRFDAGLLTDTRAEQIPLYTMRYNEDTKSFEAWEGPERGWVHRKIFNTRANETRQLLALRDAATAVIASQRDEAPVQQREQLRAHLNRLYDAYVGKHGAINRFKLTTPKAPTQKKHDDRMAEAELKWRDQNGEYDGAVPAELLAEWDARAWEPAAPQRRRPHVEGGLLHDPGWADLAALEIFDENTGLPKKAPIFSVDLLTAPVVIDHADSIDDALAISMDARHRVDVEHIAQLLGDSVENTRDRLSGLVYPSLHNPAELIPAAQALSGNVRRKLAAAETAAAADPVYRDYVRALRHVVPADKMPSDIAGNLGAPWIAAHYIEQFAKETFGISRIEIAHHEGRWAVDAPGYQRHTVAITETWGTDARDAIDLLDLALNMQRIVVDRPAAEVQRTGGPSIDREATIGAQAKSAKIKERFAQWLWEDQTRADALMAEFNMRFNSLRAPRHDGTALTLPGLTKRFEPHSYQRDAVARIIAEPTVLLDHVVGAGKSGTMFMGAMELKRLGLVKQPWLVVPNHLIEQIGREAKWWYPTANILLGASGANAEDRRRLAAQSAASDWDMVIVPQSVFERINVAPQRREEYIEREMAALREQLGTTDSSLTKKMIEATLKRHESALRKLHDQTKKDIGITFEQTGCDYLFIDEAHEYKNKQRISQIQELNCAKGSNRASDLDLKLMVLRDRRRQEALAAGINPEDIVERVATFATGTPVANSLGELYVMQSYLRPDLLAEAGVSSINDWGAAFTTMVNVIEVNATGTGLHPVARIGKFTNLQELLGLSSIFTDVVTRDQVRDQLRGSLPTLHGDQRTIITITPSQEVKDFITDLAFRASAIDPERMDVDNILKISNDGRNVSLDPRLANIAAPEVSRASRVAEEIMRIHQATAENIYTNPTTGVPMELPGGLQIVFCDRGTPKEGREFSMYSAMRDELIARGMPAERIRFIHDADKPEDRLKLLDQCNRGEVSVLIGSTQKMGTGTNIQTRAVALHHVDVPWRPADLEQREGRIIRQGNQNQSIEILNYVTEGSFDTFMWQKVEAKSLFIEQIRRSEIHVSEAEDIGGEFTASAAATKAAATGDDRYIRQVQLHDEVQRLDALQRSHLDAQARRDRRVREKNSDVARVAQSIERLDPLVEGIAERATHPPHLTVDDQLWTERKDAAVPFSQACRRTFEALKNRPGWEQRPIAVFNGLQVLGQRDHFNGKLSITFDVPAGEVAISSEEIYAASYATVGGGDAKARGLLQRVENLYKGIPAHHTALQQTHDLLTDELDDLTSTAAPEFEHRDELGEKRAMLEELTAILRMESESAEAKAAEAEAAERLRAAGHAPGWTLHLNPTPALIEQAGLRDADAYRQAYEVKRQLAARAYQAAQRQRENPDHAEGRDKRGDEGLTR